MKQNFLALVILFCQITIAQTSQENFSELDHFIKKLQLETNSQSISAAIYMNNSLFWANGFEIQDDEVVQVNGNRSYRIGSVSKVFTSAILEMMRAENKLNLDDPVFEYLPKFGEKGKKISLRSLANHTSGVRHYDYGEEKLARKPYDSSIESLELFVNDPLLFEPKTNYYYSSYGYNLIAACLEKIAEKSYEILLQEYITQPYGFNSIEVEKQHDFKPEYVDVYEGKRKVVQAKDLSYKWASGGLRSNVTDLVKFGALFFDNNSTFDSNSKLNFFTQGTLKDGTSVSHAVGWKADMLNTGERIIYHNGEVQGGRTHFLVIPGLNISVAISVNRGSYFSLDEGLFLVQQALVLEKKPFGAKFKRDEEKISKVVKSMHKALRDFRTGLKEANLELINDCVSNDFSNPKWKDKSKFIDFLTDKLSNKTVIEEDTEIDLSIGGIENGAISTVDNLKYKNLFDKDYTFIFTFFDEKWSLTSISEKL
ncbi:serine hydrolase [Winogradskyella sp.]|uniref:serine hydrolase domain-containing protein n=1 Tax=Winogradskyella sp. TaxID=1883156 RepID=UPI00261211E0|nr:serine hydrolase domain-containing protein [Winogradskyella sp.]